VTQTVMTPLRQRMLDDMKLRNMALSTRKIYVSSVAGFSAYHGRSPDQLTLEDVRDYQLHLVARGLKASSIWTQTVMKVDRGPPPYRGRRSA
jgi:integrase/recombinase XerD